MKKKKKKKIETIKQRFRHQQFTQQQQNKRNIKVSRRDLCAECAFTCALAQTKIVQEFHFFPDVFSVIFTKAFFIVERAEVWHYIFLTLFPAI